MKLNKVYLFAALLVIAVALFVYFTSRGTLTATLAEGSEIKDGAVISLSSDKFRRTHLLPASVKLRPGQYTVIAYAPNSQIFQQQITIENDGQTNLEISLIKSSNAQLTSFNPSAETLEGIEHFSKFPHVTGDYRVEAYLNDQATAIELIRITVIHHFAAPSEKALYKNERDLAVAAAKAWLKENSIPENIPTEIIDD